MPDEFVFIEPEFALAYADVCAVAGVLFLGLRGCGGVTSFHKVSLSPGVPIVVCSFSIFELAESKIFNSLNEAPGGLLLVRAYRTQVWITWTGLVVLGI